MLLDYLRPMITIPSNQSEPIHIWLQRRPLHWKSNLINLINLPMTTDDYRRLSDDYPITIWWISDDYLMTVRWLSHDYTITIQWLSYDYPMTITSFWHFRAFDFHQTPTISSLPLNMSRKLLSEPELEFWPIFDICHRLRPYLCSKRVTLGFYKQATHRRPGD